MLGDINIAEPGALIGFAGPRVVKDTTGQDLPDGFQTAEFVLEHGFLDFITHRKELKKKVNLYLDLVLNRALSQS
jgi:acetyl-CoA carboxylase carboxyl transferase subunit beta